MRSPFEKVLGLGINQYRLEKVRTSQLKDQRDRKTTGGKRKWIQEWYKIIDQISRFPTYISHYTCRAETTAKFLPTELTGSQNV
nr:unnamed protein product [Callosobruchus chinensis]